jgi:hypothetical protein
MSLNKVSWSVSLQNSSIICLTNTSYPLHDPIETIQLPVFILWWEKAETETLTSVQAEVSQKHNR